MCSEWRNENKKMLPEAAVNLLEDGEKALCGWNNSFFLTFASLFRSSCGRVAADYWGNKSTFIRTVFTPPFFFSPLETIKDFIHPTLQGRCINVCGFIVHTFLWPYRVTNCTDCIFPQHVSSTSVTMVRRMDGVFGWRKWIFGCDKRKDGFNADLRDRAHTLSNWLYMLIGPNWCPRGFPWHNVAAFYSPPLPSSSCKMHSEFSRKVALLLSCKSLLFTEVWRN